MDFQTLARRELQALCKLNKIPANITNVAMVEALSSLDIVVGIEDFLKPSESSETTETSVESPARTEIMSPRVPRTGYRTSTRQKPVREESETVQTVTRTSRRGVRRQTAGEAEDSKTVTVPETPASLSTQRRAPARKNMETQLNESIVRVKVEESIDQEKKSVPITPAAVMPNSRRKGPEVSTTRRMNAKEDSMFGRTYSTRRSARLAEEVKVEEPKKECEKLEKIDSLSTQSFEEMLDDEGSDILNAVTEDSSLSVGIESKSELLKIQKEKASGVDTGSNNMEVDVIPSDIQNPSELNKLENVENPDRDTDSEETLTELIPKTADSDNIVSDNENPSEDSKLETVEKLSSHEEMELVDVAAAELENEEVLDNKGADVYPSAMENSSETFEQENVGTFEGMSTDEESENSSETLKQENLENVCTYEDMYSDGKTATVVEIAVLENRVENLNEIEETNSPLAEVSLVDGVLNSSESDVESKNLEKGDLFAQDENKEEFEFPVLMSPIEDAKSGFSNEEMSENVDQSVVSDILADFSSISLVSIPCSEVKVPSSTPLKKSAARTPSQSRKMALLSDDKENIDQSGTKLQLEKDVETKTKTLKDQSNALHEASLRQLHKMLKEKLKLNNNADETTNNMTKVVTTTRPALHTLSSNSLAATETKGK